MPRTEKTQIRPRMSLLHGLLVAVIALFVLVFISVSLWATISAMTQKAKVAKEIGQIIDIVDMIRQYSAIENGFGFGSREDVLAKLSSIKKIQVSGNENEGLKTQANPWGGMFVAYTVPPNFFRIETVVPSRACFRIVNLLKQNIRSLGIKQIDAKGVDESWRQIFVDKGADPASQLTSEQIAAGCRSDQSVILDFTFSLR